MHAHVHVVRTRQGLTLAGKKLEVILVEQQDHQFFAAHSSLGWSAGERGQFEITKLFLECKNAVPTTEPQPLKAEEKCAAVSPRKAPSAIKINPPPTKKPAAKAKAPAPPKTQAQSWRGPVSVLMAAFLVALVAMTCAAFGSEDATSFASAAGAQSILYTNSTGDLDVVSRHPGICFDPVADDQSSVLSAGNDLLHHCETVCGELSVRCDAAGLMTEALHANTLPPSALSLGGLRHSDWHNLLHQNAEGMQYTPHSRSDPAAKGTNLFADFGSPLKESASLAEQVRAATTHAAAPSRFVAPLHVCPPCTIAPHQHTASFPACCTRFPHFRTSTLRP